jgi:hypothetical protein
VRSGDLGVTGGRASGGSCAALSALAGATKYGADDLLHGDQRTGGVASRAPLDRGQQVLLALRGVGVERWAVRMHGDNLLVSDDP